MQVKIGPLKFGRLEISDNELDELIVKVYQRVEKKEKWADAFYFFLIALKNYKALEKHSYEPLEDVFKEMVKAQNIDYLVRIMSAKNQMIVKAVNHAIESTAGYNQISKDFEEVEKDIKSKEFRELVSNQNYSLDNLDQLINNLLRINGFHWSQLFGLKRDLIGFIKHLKQKDAIGVKSFFTQLKSIAETQLEHSKRNFLTVISQLSEFY